MKTLAALLLIASAAFGAGLQLPVARSGQSTALENALRTPGTVSAFHVEPVGRLAGAPGALVEIAAIKILNRPSQTAQIGARVVINNELQAFIDIGEFEALQGLLRDLPLYEQSTPTPANAQAVLARVVTRGGLVIDLETSAGVPSALVLSMEKDDGRIVSARFAPGAYEQLTKLIDDTKAAAQRLL